MPWSIGCSDRTHLYAAGAAESDCRRFGAAVTSLCNPVGPISGHGSAGSVAVVCLGRAGGGTWCSGCRRRRGRTCTACSAGWCADSAGGRGKSLVVQDAVTRHDLPAGRFRPRRQTVDSLLGMTTPATRLRLRDLADELGIDTAHATTLLRHACAGHAGRPPRKPFGSSTVVGQSLAARVRNLGRQPTTTVDNPPVGDRPPAVSSDTAPTTTETATSPGTLFQAPGARPVPAVVPAAHPSLPVPVVDFSVEAEHEFLPNSQVVERVNANTDITPQLITHWEETTPTAAPHRTPLPGRGGGARNICPGAPHHGYGLVQGRSRSRMSWERPTSACR